MQLTQILALGGSLFAHAAYAAVVSIDVGENGELVMKPNSVKASVGDVVQFSFYPQDHTVVQAATIDKPCEPLSGGFYSGEMKVSAKSDKVFQINITNTDPIWYYCAVSRHCNSGMVGVINPPSDGAIDTFINNAKSATVVKPTSNGPDGGSIVSPGENSSSGRASATGTSASSEGSASATAKATSGSTTGGSASATAQATSTSKAAAAAVTEHAGLILPVIFAAAGLVL